MLQAGQWSNEYCTISFCALCPSFPIALLRGVVQAHSLSAPIQDLLFFIKIFKDFPALQSVPLTC